MAIKITVSDKVGFTVEGAINDADGNSQPFKFGLTAKRLDEDESAKIQARLVLQAAKDGHHKGLIDELKKLITNWTDVRDDKDAPVAFTAKAFGELLNTHRGLAMLVWRTYLNEQGAKEKN